MSPEAHGFGRQTAGFFDLYAKLAQDPDSIGSILNDKVAALASTESAVETGLSLFLVALYAQKTGDRALVESTSVANACVKIVRQLERATSAPASNPCDTWVLAVFWGALANVNLFLKRDEFARAASGVKNHVYANNISQNVLMSSPDLITLGFDVLFSSVPMGLFEPEDLVLVAAVGELGAPERLARASSEEKLLLSWYFTEQGNYQGARDLAGASTNPGPLKAIVEQRLFSLGQLSERFIIHAPSGNGNRYQPLVEERFPKLVTDKDKVTIRARSAPFSADDPLELVAGKTIISGSMRQDCWQFEIPAMPGGFEISYYLRFAKTPHENTRTFRFEVLHRRRMALASGVLARPDEIVIWGENCAITLLAGDDGQLNIDIKPGATSAERPMKRQNRQQINIGGFGVDIVLAPFSLQVRQGGKQLFDAGQLCWLEDNDGNVSQIEMSLDHDPCRIYGLGERYNALNQYGNRLDQFVYNQYKDQGVRTYIPMPVFYSDAGFGVHVNTTSYSWFDFASSSNNRITLGAEESALCLQIFFGSINTQIGQFIKRTGKPQMVPVWALGPWMSSNNWDSEREVRRQVALSVEHKIPATVLVIEAWSDEATFYVFNDATYTETDGDTALAYSDFSFPDWGRWPDPKGLVAHLHAHDLKCLLWQIPIIKQVTSLTHLQKSNDEAALVRNGFGVKNADGTPYRLPEGWFKDALLLDFTNRQAREWWFEKRQYLIDDVGVDGFKTDGGECVFGNDLVFADGSDGLKMRNKYPNDYVSAYYEFAQQNNGITFSRSGYTGAQKFPAHWAGDERSSWGAFKRSMLAGLSAGMSGIIFWGWDLAGFSGPVPSAELYIRSVQMACFCPIMQYHAESRAEHNQDRTPWNIAERSGEPRALSLYRFYANLRMSLMPYLAREAKHCVASHTPMMRAMVLDYQDDPRAGKLWDQYLFGRDLLVAPIIAEGETSRSVYLPQGNWWHLFDNKWFEGGSRLVPAPLNNIAVFVRAGAIVPLAFDDEICLGATMPADTRKPGHMVLLVTNYGQGKNYYQSETGARICVRWNQTGEVEITTEGTLEKQYSIVLTGRATSAFLNTEEAEIGVLALAGAPLPRIII